MEHVVIEAPDAFAAFVLSRRLDPLGQTADVELEDRRFVVDVRVDERDLVRLLGSLQRWLDEAEVDSLRLRMGDREYLLAA